MDKTPETLAKVAETLEACSFVVNQIKDEMAPVDDPENTESPGWIGKHEMDVLEGVIAGDIRGVFLYPVGPEKVAWCPFNTTYAEMEGMARAFIRATGSHWRAGVE